jgi:hypothetical protein
MIFHLHRIFDTLIEKIIVEPTPHEDLSIASIEALLLSEDIKSCKVKGPGVPYRTL